MLEMMGGLDALVGMFGTRWLCNYESASDFVPLFLLQVQGCSTLFFFPAHQRQLRSGLLGSMPRLASAGLGGTRAG